MTVEESYSKAWDKNQMLISIAKANDDKEHRELLNLYNKISSFLTYGAKMVFKENALKVFRAEMWAAFAQRTLNFNPNITLDKLRMFTNGKLPKSLGVWDCVLIMTSYFRSVDEMTTYAENFTTSVNDIGEMDNVPEIFPYAVYMANKRKNETVEKLKNVDVEPEELNMSEVESVDSFMNFDNFFASDMNLKQFYQNKDEQ